MKKLLLIFCTAAALTGLSLHAQPEGSQEDLHEILRKHTRAVGRVDLYRRLNSYIARGTMQQGEALVPFTLYKREGRMRMEVDAPGGQTILVYDGKKAWKWQTSPSSGELVCLNRQKTDWLGREARFEDLMFVYKELGYHEAYLGRVTLEDGNDAYQIRLTDRSSDEQIDVFLNTVSFLEFQRNFRPKPGDAVLETLFSDYREVDGILVPFRVENRMEGKILSVVTLDDVEINAGVLKFYFQQPSGREIVIQPEPGQS